MCPGGSYDHLYRHIPIGGVLEPDRYAGVLFEFALYSRVAVKNKIVDLWFFPQNRPGHGQLCRIHIHDNSGEKQDVGPFI
ncbi:MAG: hypothetical protein HUU41_20400 [Bryobacteraceae bacterium]|nr:hypothetical protein [Bryobacterales bacterium]MEB2361722.1 hypothetical protein [Bryobacterales bacterium]NUN03475.1 hypothetical protein [Bryobacteraceae bacterium]